ncbi:MAG: phosphomannomutase, partial [Desulfuromonadales bacterium]|nr:phosphomannomutase [Desulfuromonadales bacterium]
CGTEEVYFAAFSQPVDGGIMVTASHNPMDYNGMKLVRAGARPISGDSGLDAIRQLAENGLFAPAGRRGEVRPLELRGDYVRHLLGYLDPASLRPLRLVVNAGNGCAAPAIDALAPHLPFELVRVHHQPDGTFPNGIPNPLLPENRAATRDAVLEYGADMGIAWDGDFDRCFLFDEQGNFIEGYYIVGLLAEALLQGHPGAKIIHDPRLTWNTIDLVRAAGGVPVQSKTGHAFIKERMRAEDAIYGGEMSAHHSFRDFAYCDSGMIPWLLVAALMSATGQPLSALVGERMRRYPASGEINRRLADPQGAIAAVEEQLAHQALAIDRTDGLSLEFPAWRFNLRCSNTEPVLRLNVEARGDEQLMRRMTRTLLAVVDRF